MANIFFEDLDLDLDQDQEDFVDKESKRIIFRTECIKDFQDRKRNLQNWFTNLNEDW